MNNKALRKSARHNLKRNYWACIAVCFLLLLFGAEYASSDGIFGERSDYASTEQQVLQEQGVDEDSMINHQIKGSQLGQNAIDNATSGIENRNVKKATRGVMASLANSLTKTAHTMTFAADAFKNIIGRSPVAVTLVAILGMLLSLVYYLFFQVQLRIGERRFFLENRLYADSRPTRIFWAYTTPNVGNTAWIMLCKAVFQFLWCFTIVGGVMKYYEYRCIPYILAENPGISRRDCFALAKTLSYGHKMEMFKFDLSYIFWFVLGFISFGLLNIFYVNPYYRMGQTEFQVKLRELAKAASTDHIQLLDDDDLYEYRDNGGPADLYPSIKVKAKHELSVSWDRKYPLVHIGLIFFTFAMIGWCWEVLYHFILDGSIVNRGSLWGPWLPIYGVGGACVVAVLKPLGKKPVVLAICTFIACGIIEYTTGWYFETFKGIRYWNYSKYLFNIDGRVCLEGLIMFTVLAMLGLYVIAPRIDDLFRKIPAGVKVPLLCVLAAAFIGDLGYSHFHPHTGKGISSGGSSLELIHYYDNADILDIDREVKHV